MLYIWLIWNMQKMYILSYTGQKTHYSPANDHAVHL